MRFRRLAVLAVILAAMEGLGYAADGIWSFRGQLLRSFEMASESDADETPLWHDPSAPFQAGFAGHRQVLGFRFPGSEKMTAERLDPATLPAGKRVIALGESAVFGVNVPSDKTFSALLGDWLKPQGIQVLNAGQVAADPWLVLDAGAQLLKNYSPSALIIFTGNNPWALWRPPQQRPWNSTDIAILRALASSRAIAGLEVLMIRGMFLYFRPPSAGFGDHHELSGSGYALESPLEPTAQFKPADWAGIKSEYLKRFESSLDELVKQSKTRNIRTVLVTMPFNYKLSVVWKHPQFDAYDPSHADEVRRLLQSAGKQVQSGDCAAALPDIDKALALDPQPPLLHYLRAQCLEKANRLDEAEAEYAQSRERMIGNLGSRLSVNEVIRRVAARQGVPLVDAAKLFDDYEHAHGKHFNEDTIVDDCHPSVLGHELIAKALLPLLQP